MDHTNPSLACCQLCREEHPNHGLTAGQTVRPPVAERMRRDHPHFEGEGGVCSECLAKYRAEYVRSMLEEEGGELSRLDEEVVTALRNQELIAANINEEFGERMTFGQRVADRVAKFGGSWTFIGSFGLILVVWMTINGTALLSKPFDPYPFILLNLVLSSLAALQAPVIMMSQNRQSSKDRLTAEHDYRVNLKAELEVRLLHTKIDQLLTHQWHRLIEIQQLQMDLLEEIGRRSDGGER